MDVWFEEMQTELTLFRIYPLKKSERMEQIERDGHISVKIAPSQELSDYILGELKNIK